MIEHVDSGGALPSVVRRLRERISRWLYIRQEVLESVLWGLLSTILIVGFVREFEIPARRGGLAEFYPIFAVAVFVLGFISWRVSLFALGASLTILGVIYYPEFGYLLAVVTMAMMILSLFGRMELLLVIAAPFLVNWCPIAIPLLAGFVLGKKNGSMWTVFSLLMAMGWAAFVGSGRLGIPGDQELRAMMEGYPNPNDLRTVVERYLTQLDFGPIQAAFGTLTGYYRVRLVAQILLWAGTATAVGWLYLRKPYTDRLAEDYIRRAQVTAAPKVENKYRSMPAAIALGSLTFMLGSVILHVVLPAEGMTIVRSFPYSMDRFMLVDLPASVLVVAILAFRFTGDPSFTKTAKSESRAKMARRFKDTGAPPRKSSIFFPGSSASLPEKRSQREPIPSPGSTSRGDIGTRLGRPKTAALGTSEWKPEMPEAETPDVPQSVFKLHEKIDDQYTIDKIQAGGMGVVYIVTDEFSGKRYAVKSLKDELTNNPESVERFSNEAKTWINLDHHPNIVQAMLYRTVKGRPLLFLEYVEGTDLENLLGMSRGYSIQQIVDWAKQICRGMAYAHKKKFPGGQVGLIHRDLKPANLMVTRDGGIKITDFGLAKVIDTVTGLTRDRSGLGTLMYMPPEQLESAKDVDRRADIYSFGAVVYEILTGTPPFTSDSMSSLCMKILSEAPEPPSRTRPDCPPELDRIVLKCLEKQRDHRFTGFEEIEKELDAIIPSSAQTIVPPGPSRRAGRPTPSPTSIARSGVRPSSGSTSRASYSSQSTGGDSGGVTLIEGILFLDMVASTARGTKYGDSLILRIKEELRQIVEMESNRFSAAFTKGMGDGYMITFPDAESAVRAGCNIMRRVSARNQSSPRFRRIDLRMGIHFGEVHLDGAGDRQGSSVNMASRLQSAGATDFHQTQAGIDLEQLSEENRIFISEVVNEELAEHKQFKTRLVGFFDLKGFTGRHRVFELLWK